MQGPHVHEWLPTGRTLTEMFGGNKSIEFYCLPCRSFTEINFKFVKTD